MRCTSKLVAGLPGVIKGPLSPEVKEPEKTIPRVIVISILVIAVLYIVMQACIISVLPYETASTSKSVVTDYIRVLLGDGVGNVRTNFWETF